MSSDLSELLGMMKENGGWLSLSEVQNILESKPEQIEQVRLALLDEKPKTGSGTAPKP